MAQALYSVGVGSIKSINPYTHVYRLQNLMQVNEVGDATCINAIPIGARGNTLEGVQSQYSYQIGDTVLFVHQTEGASTTSLGFILGVITTELITEDSVPGTSWDGANLNYKNFPRFDEWSQTSGAQRILTNVGHNGIDMLPACYEMTGKLVAFQFSDYYAALRATCAELLVSGMDRRIILQSMLRTDSTVNSLSDIAILNESTIDTYKWCGNVKDAWYNCVKEEDDLITSTGKSPRYRIFEQSGDVLYGKHTTLLDQSGTTPLYTEYLGLDGTKKLLSASRLILGKYPGVIATEYVGDRLSVEEHKDEDPTPENIPDPTSNLDVTSKNWAVYANMEFLNNGGYPEEFLNATKGEYDDFEPAELQDSLRKDKKIKVSPGNSYIEFQDDGGIKLIDAWGSFILLSHGNIEIHAVNNIFGVSGRDTLMFAGGNRTDFAKNDIAVQAYTGALQLAAGDNLDIHADVDINIEAKRKVHSTAATLEITAPTISVICRDATKPSGNGRGRFQLLAPNGVIDVSGMYLRQQATQVSITSDMNALVVSHTGVTTTGLLDVRGGIISTTADLLISVPNDTKLHKFSAGKDTQWVNTGAGLRINGNLTTTGALTASGGIYGQALGVVTWTNNRPQKVNLKGLRQATNITDSAPRIPEGISVVPLKIDAFDEYAFSFAPTNVTTLYRVVNTQPTKNKSRIIYKGYYNYKRDVSYIYPGQAFWETSGALNVSTNETSGFASIPTANI